MHPQNAQKAAFKRQVVFRIGADDWPLLEHAAAEHGSIQAAVLAGLRALAARPDPATGPAAAEQAEADQGELESAAAKRRAEPRPGRPKKSSAAEPAREGDRDEEIPAREAAQLLELKTSTVSGYIRSGRLPGRYDAAPSWRGWLTTRAAVAVYAKRR